MEKDANLSKETRETFEQLIDESLQDEYYSRLQFDFFSQHPADVCARHEPVNIEDIRALLVEMWGGIINETEIDAACERFLTAHRLDIWLADQARQ
jgi:hypothetical protein